MNRKRRGYTLFELVLVMALLVLLAGLSVPPIESMYSDYKVEAAVDQVRGQWASIRARAIIEGRSYRFAVAPGGGDFRVAPDASDFWSGGDAPATTDTDIPPLVVQDSLPRGIRFGPADAGDSAPVDDNAPNSQATIDPGSWVTVAVFLPDGTAKQDVEIVFRSRDAGPIALRLRALTGGVTTRRPLDSAR